MMFTLKNERTNSHLGAAATLVYVCSLATIMSSAAAEPQAENENADVRTNISTGSGNQYKTTVIRETEGELSPEDFRQASLLASRVALHLNNATGELTNEQVDQARQELEKGLALVRVVRELLPTTVVSTVVEDKDGNEVYHYVDRVQQDRIPLHEGLIAVNTMEPITDAKQEEATVQGIRLADADLLHTSVRLELGYVEGKLKGALKLLNDKPEQALEELVMAQARGVTFAIDKQDDPLVEAQLALQLAERMSEQGRDEAARANLQQANNYLELYGGLIANGASEEVRKLQDEISRLQADIGRTDASETIRGFWNRVASWFSAKPGEMRVTATEVESAQGDTTDVVKK